MRYRYCAAGLLAASLLSFAAASCSDRGQQPEPAASFEPPPPIESSSLPADAVPSGAAVPAAGAEAAKGEVGARQVLREWARALERKDFARAQAQWRDGLPSQGDYAARLAGYRTIELSFGEGRVEGAAGSLFYEAPLAFAGVRADGARVARAGTITLRRVNDVPGATPDQLRWHIERTTLEL